LLEIYKIDWGVYPVVEAGEFFGKNTDSPKLTPTLSIELTGSGTDTSYVNIPWQENSHRSPRPYRIF
jgi:hypothetical protein